MSGKKAKIKKIVHQVGINHLQSELHKVWPNRISPNWNSSKSSTWTYSIALVHWVKLILANSDSIQLFALAKHLHLSQISYGDTLGGY